MTTSYPRSAATLELSACPIGLVFNTADPDQGVEDRFFAGWVEPYRASAAELSSYRAWTVRDESKTGRRVLQHEDKRTSGLLAGTADWRDYRVRARVRQVLATTWPSQDDEYKRVARTGLVFRQGSVRRFYHFGMEGYDDFVLHRRRDDTWEELGRANLAVDRARYYDLEVEITGNRIRCALDGRTVIEVSDDGYGAGAAGIRTDTVARFESVEVDMTAAAWEQVIRAGAQRRAAVTALRARQPRAVLWRAIPAPAGPLVGLGTYGPERMRTAWFLEESTAARSVLSCQDLEGRLLWRTVEPGRLLAARVMRSSRTPLWDFTGDGCTDLLCVLRDRLTIIDGASGRIRQSVAAPPTGPFMGLRGQPAIPSPFKDRAGVYLNTVQLQPAPHPRGIVLSEDSSAGGNTLWAYDHNLELLWTAHVDQPKFGHSTFSYDVDGDGREEILAGGHLLDAEGRLLWTLEDSEYWDCFQGARHVDESFILNLTGNPADGLTAVLAAGLEGLIYADARTGKIRTRHSIGHVQFCRTGNFRPDLPGLETWTADRHGNFGILTLFDCQGRELFQFQPGFQLYQPVAVNWTGDGSHLMLLHSSQISGLWDAAGEQVVAYPASEQETLASVLDVCGDDRDELVFHSQGTLRIYTQE